MEKYAARGELAVGYDTKKLHKAHYTAAGTSLLVGQIWQNTNKSDPMAAQRTLIRHDGKAVANAILELYDYAGKKS